MLCLLGVGFVPGRPAGLAGQLRECEGGVTLGRGLTWGGGGAGEYLESSADSTCTWLSSDGGQSWIDVLPTAAIYEVRARSRCPPPRPTPAVASRTSRTRPAPPDPLYGKRLAPVAAPGQAVVARHKRIRVVRESGLGGRVLGTP